jgi:hypothetical protein
MHEAAVAVSYAAQNQAPELSFLEPSLYDTIVSYGLPIVLLLVTLIVYACNFWRYRNTNKRHHHEVETRADIFNVQEYDQFNKRKNGRTGLSMHGRNDELVEGSLRLAPSELAEEPSDTKAGRK